MVGPPYTAGCNMPVWRLDNRRVASSRVEMLKRIGAGQLRDAKQARDGRPWPSAARANSGKLAEAHRYTLALTRMRVRMRSV
jgi:hypothetical protein